MTGVWWGTRAAVKWYNSYFLVLELFQRFKKGIRGHAEAVVCNFN